MEQEIISKLLNTIEAVIENDKNGDMLSSEEKDEYIIAAIWAHKKYGRPSLYVQSVVDSREGLPIYDLHKAGLTYEDYLATYHYKHSA